MVAILFSSGEDVAGEEVAGEEVIHGLLTLFHLGLEACIWKRLVYR